MKTTSMKWKGLLVAVMAFFTVNLSKAQCPYVKNNLPCPLEVRIYYYSGPNTLCTGMPITYNIPANTNFLVNCPTGCFPTSAIKVQVVKVNGSPITPIGIDDSTIVPPNNCSSNTTVPTACSGSPVSICWNSTEFEVN